MNRILTIICFCIFVSFPGFGQVPTPASHKVEEPFKILTQGKKITVKTKSKINKLMIWTASGHRIAEDHNLNTNTFSYSVNVPENIFYIMMELADGKRYTKKIGLHN